MAEKAILDGKDAGFTFFRVGVTGYAPSKSRVSQRNDLGLWQTDPKSYWVLVDRMFDDLDRADVRLVPTFVWNVFQFPSLADEHVGTLVREPQSKSRILLNRYIGDFIGRYKGRKTIIFYELSNELNLWADLDHQNQCMSDEPAIIQVQCKTTAHFSTGEMIEFSRQLVSEIKRLDPAKQVSSGYGLPRPAAHHLELRPAFSPQGPDWTVDTIEQFQENLSRTQDMFDIISIHMYPQVSSVGQAQTNGHVHEIISEVSNVARVAHKKVFLGEFGEAGASPFLRNILEVVAGGSVDYAAVWVWGYYQNNTYQTYNTDATRYNLATWLNR